MFKRFVIFTIFMLFPMISLAAGYQTDYVTTTSMTAEIYFSLEDYDLNLVTGDGVTYTSIDFAGQVVTTQKGYAEVPFLSVAVQLTPDRNVRLETIDADYIDIPLDYPLLPSRGTIYRNQNPGLIPYEIDPTSLTDSWYPEDLATKTEPYIFRDIRGVNIYVYPFRYNAVRKTLRVYSQVTVRLVEEDTPSINPLPRHRSQIARVMDPVYRSLFINYNKDREFPHQLAEMGEMLVIYTARDGEAIQPYIDWKRLKGFVVHTLEVAPGTNVTADVQAAYDDNPNLLYVQLVGDYNDVKSNLGTGENVPMDPTLGHVAGNDNFGDLIIGRFSANSPAEVTVQVDKAINYEQMATGGDWLSVGMGIGSNEGASNGDDGEIDYVHIDVIKENKLLPYTYTDVLEMYHNPSAPSASAVATGINDGLSLINYCGHGSSNSWGTSGFSNSNIAGLTNSDMLPIIISVACNNGTFNGGSNCFAEAWLKKENGGAVAVLMSSISQPWQPPMRGQDYFNDLLTGGYDYIGNPGNGTSTAAEDHRSTFGSLVFNALVLMYAESGGPDDLNTIKTWTIFGDASLQVRTTAPQEVTLTNSVILSAVPFNTTLLTDNGPVANALVSLSQNGQVYTGLTDENGEVTVEHLLLPGTAQLVVTGLNLATVNTEVVVVPPDGPYVMIDEYEVMDENAAADYGETVILDVTLVNYGSADASDATATLTTDDFFVTLLDDTETVDLVPANDTVHRAGAFSFVIADYIEDQHQIPFTLTVGMTGNDPWTSTFFVPVNAPNLTVGYCEVNDDAGNGNGRLDAGETIYLMVPTTNEGHATAPAATALIYSTSEYVSIVDNSFDLVPLAPGVTFNAVYTLIVSEECPAGESVLFSYSVEADHYNAYEEFSLSVGLILEDFETGDFNRFPWTHDGNAPWEVVADDTYEGAYSAQSGTINHSENSVLSMEIEVLNPGEISFYRKLSSESGYDFLRFYIDDAEMGSWAGELPWEQVAFPVTEGVHIFQWVYSKDTAVSTGSDCAWIDFIVLPQVSTGTPYPPANLVVDMQGTRVVLNWDAPESTMGFRGYNVYRNGEQLNSNIIPMTMYIDRTCEFGVEYIYEVTAVFEEGESFACDAVTFTPTLSCPMNLIASVELNDVTLAWSAPTGMEEQPVTVPVQRKTSQVDQIRPDQEVSTRAHTGYNIYRDGEMVAAVDQSVTSYDDLDLPNGSYLYTITAVYDEGESGTSNEVSVIVEVTGVEENILALPTAHELSQNFPNPFNPATTINFALPAAGAVKLQIINAAGQVVSTLFDGEMPAGYHHLVWNGTSDRGLPAASGIYFYQLDAANFSSRKSMILIK